MFFTADLQCSSGLLHYQAVPLSVIIQHLNFWTLSSSIWNSVESLPWSFKPFNTCQQIHHLESLSCPILVPLFCQNRSTHCISNILCWTNTSSKPSLLHRFSNPLEFLVSMNQTQFHFSSQSSPWLATVGIFNQSC